MAVYQLSDNKKGKKRLNKRNIGFILLGISSFALLFLLTSLFAPVTYFILGTLGLFAYPLTIVIFVLGIALINGRKYVMPKRYAMFLFLAIFFLLGILQLIIMGGVDGRTFAEYLGANYSRQLTAGGILVGLFTSIFLYLLSTIGAYLVFVIGFIVSAALVSDCIYYSQKREKAAMAVKIQIKDKPKNPKQVKEDVSIVMAGKINEEILKEKSEALNKLGLVRPGEILQGTPLPKVETKPAPTRREIILTPPELDLEEFFKQSARPSANTVAELKRNEPVLPTRPAPVPTVQENIFEQIKKEEVMPSKIVHDDSFDLPQISERAFPVPERRESAFIRDIVNENFQTKKANPLPDLNGPAVGSKFGYVRPGLNLLSTESVDTSKFNEDVAGRRLILENTLETFGIPAKVINVIIGPAVTRYELEMPPGISVKKVTSHADDIALYLEANGEIRIEAPIPGKSAVGIEVPNKSVATVAIKEILASKEFNASPSPLTFALGKDISGAIRICNLQKMPHLLVAGSTGSGKSVCLNSIIMSFIYKSAPEDVRLILIDPKRVEFAMYEGLPHLLMPTVITDAVKAINAFNWAIDEMERRFMLLQDTKTRNIDEYNSSPDVISGHSDKMPFIVIIVDELADLMMMNKKEVEEKIMRLAQKARAAGIHLILATQRPSVDVITGTIKANLTSRIAFAVTSYPDSATILSQGGAEKLLGKGDMLYAPSDAAQPKRIQGCFVSGSEVDAVVDFAINHNSSIFDKEVAANINAPGRSASGSVDTVGVNKGPELDPLLPQALKLFIENGQASITMIQRRFVMGYPRAARIIDQMQQANYISASEGGKPRSVYITMEEYKKLFPEGANDGN